MECYSGMEVLVKPGVNTAVHVDGEGYKLTGEARFSIRPQSLRVLCPKAYAENLHLSARKTVAV